MNLLLIGIATISSVTASASEVRIVEGSVNSKWVQVPTNGQGVQVELREVALTISFPSGKSGYADLVMLYEPQSGLFWWMYQAKGSAKEGESLGRFLSHSLLYLTDAKVLCLMMFDPFLYVRESAEHYSTIANGQASAVAAIQGAAGQIETGGMVWFSEVNVGQALGAEFSHLERSASPSPTLKLREVKRHDDQWYVIVDGPNKDAATVVLSDSYQLISATSSSAQPR